MMPGMMVLPATSMRAAHRRAPHRARRPDRGDAVAFDQHGAILDDARRWRPERSAGADIVMMRAPTSAIEPDGMSLVTVKPIGIPWSRARRPSPARSTKVKGACRDRA